MPVSRRSAFSWRRLGPKLRPSNTIVPLSAVSRPLMQRSSVLLPEPLRPMIATTSPVSISSEISLRTLCPANALEMPFNAKRGIDAPFEMLAEQRQRPADHEVKSGDHWIDDHRLEGDIRHKLAGSGQLDEADDRSDRCAFDQLDDKADGGRD